MRRTCAWCGSRLRSEKHVCPVGGAALGGAECDRCGAAGLDPRDIYCRYCFAPLGRPVRLFEPPALGHRGAAPRGTALLRLTRWRTSALSRGALIGTAISLVALGLLIGLRSPSTPVSFPDRRLLEPLAQDAFHKAATLAGVAAEPSPSPADAAVPAMAAEQPAEPAPDLPAAPAAPVVAARPRTPQPQPPRAARPAAPAVATAPRPVAQTQPPAGTPRTVRVGTLQPEDEGVRPAVPTAGAAATPPPAAATGRPGEAGPVAAGGGAATSPVAEDLVPGRTSPGGAMGATAANAAAAAARPGTTAAVKPPAPASKGTPEDSTGNALNWLSPLRLAER